MAYTLDQLAADIGQSLTRAPEAHEKLCPFVEKALKDPGFRAANLGPDKTAPRTVIYEDKARGFCICAHVYTGAASSKPHDHGPSWAIYGQAEGVTEMTDWRIVRKADGERPALVEPVKTYMLKPGMAHYYGVGAVHAPRRDGPTKLIRIEGENLDKVRRTPIEAAAKAV
jgi:hypothetical protein